MSKKIFEFNQQFSEGTRGELLFLECYPEAIKTDGKVDDFIYRKMRLELKTDTFSFAQSKNFFMEYYGNVKTQKIGGPWRAKQDLIPLFCYLYIKEKVFYWFDVNPLVEFLDSYILDLTPKYVHNVKHQGMGYCVPRKDLKHLVVREDKF